MPLELSPIARRNMTRAVSFVLQHEPYCVALTEQIRLNGDGLFMLEEDGKVKGVIRAGATLLHCIPKASGTMQKVLCSFFATRQDAYPVRSAPSCTSAARYNPATRCTPPLHRSHTAHYAPANHCDTSTCYDPVVLCNPAISRASANHCTPAAHGNPPIRCINGERMATAFLADVLSTLGQKGKETNHYFLLSIGEGSGAVSIDDSTDGAADKTLAANPMLDMASTTKQASTARMNGANARTQTVDNGTSAALPMPPSTPLHNAMKADAVHKARLSIIRPNDTPQAADALMPLEIAYQKEEVLPKCRALSVRATRLMLEKALRAQRVATLVDAAGAPVSKVSLNAVGYNCVQLGGVYTLPEQRGQGLARYLVGSTVQAMLQAGRRVVLYVKEENVAALHLYSRLGFTPLGKFSIVYY